MSHAEESGDDEGKHRRMCQACFQSRAEHQCQSCRRVVCDGCVAPVEEVRREDARDEDDFLESFLRYEPDNEGLRFRIGRLRDALADRIVREEGAEAAHTTTMQELFEVDDEPANEGGAAEDGAAEGTGPPPDSASAPEDADLPDED